MALFAIAMGVVVGLWILGWVVPIWLFADGKRGEFGDMFGAVNALFSGLAFGALIVTLVLQRSDLSVQVANLAHSLREMEASTEAQRAAAAALGKQIEVQNRTSRLQAMSTLLEEYRALHAEYEGMDIENFEREETGKSFFQHRQAIRRQMIDILDQIELEGDYGSDDELDDDELGDDDIAKGG